MFKLCGTTLRRRVIAGIAAIVVYAAPIVAFSQQCTPTAIFTNQTSFSYAACGVPDFNQIDSALPNGGAMYCVPTSVLDWMAYIANTGTLWNQQLSPGPSPWQAKAITAADAALGTSMKTDSLNGTDGAGALNGTESWLTQGFQFGYFNTNLYSAFGSTGAFNVGVMAQRAINDPGYLVGFLGWYCQRCSSPCQTTHVLTRCGGHAVALTAATQSTTQYSIGINDPDSSDSIWPPLQTDAHTVKDVTTSFGGCGVNGTACQMTLTNINDNYAGNSGYFDGALEISPVASATYEPPNTIVDQPCLFEHCKQFFVRKQVCFGLCHILDITRDSLNHRDDFTVTDRSEVMQFDPATFRLSTIAAVQRPLHIAVGGYNDELYVQTPTELAAFGSSGRKLGGVPLPSDVDAIAFDEAGQRVVAISRRERAAFFFSSDLTRVSRFLLNRDICTGSSVAAKVHVSVNSSTSIAWVHCDQSPYVTRLDSAFGTTIRLNSATAPTGLFVDGRDHLYLTELGRLAEFSDGGSRISTLSQPFAFGPTVQLSRSVSNIDPRRLTGPAYYNATPAQAAARAKAGSADRQIHA